ncbi:hypothetical protein ACE1CI_14845 [Aerosakkonemataceae cyanobacterium BLCC-F50]|uniref:Uncharacterized protein n=1 Tax=Floridaenema flaviceps BLCC-F50 TaxID=3153642 RepID=A0ABV4XR68_9CYAN
MSSNLSNNSSNQNRLYTRFITNLKILQFVGYFIVVAINASVLFYNRGFASPFFFFSLFNVLISCVVIYVITEALRAIIDLLSRIERNTRSE